MLGWALVALWLGGCAGPQPAPLPLPVEEPPTAPAKDTQIKPLLERADQYRRNDQLTTPASANAFATYQEVLAIDPDNQAAFRGLERIVERYVQLALRAAEQARYAHGRLMLDRARSVDPTHPAIEPTRQQLSFLARASRERFDLEDVGLTQRRESVRQRLLSLGMRAKDRACRVTIGARTDAEGRWIYQMLNRAENGPRIRARTGIASPPHVELICPAPGS